MVYINIKYPFMLLIQKISAKKYFLYLIDICERINTFENLKILIRFCNLPWHIMLKVRFVHLIATGLTEGKRNRAKHHVTWRSFENGQQSKEIIKRKTTFANSCKRQDIVESHQPQRPGESPRNEGGYLTDIKICCVITQQQKKGDRYMTI